MATTKLPISFKNNEEEQKLYEWIISHSSYSGFVKDILKKEMKKEQKNEVKTNNLLKF